MIKFHSKLAELEVNTCLSCTEKLPGLTVRCVLSSGNAECSWCRNDKHIPTLSSSHNNMPPAAGSVIPELQVCSFNCKLKLFSTACL